MNTQLSQDRRMPTVRIPTVATQVQAGAVRPSRPPNALDRLALRIGLALIIWGRRGSAGPDRMELIRRHTVSIARQSREREYQRRWSLVGPRR